MTRGGSRGRSHGIGHHSHGIGHTSHRIGHGYGQTYRTYNRDEGEVPALPFLTTADIPDALYALHFSEKDPDCAFACCPGKFNFFDSTLPSELTNYLTREEYSDFISQINEICNDTIYPTFPCVLLHFIIPFSPICFLLYQKHNRRERISELIIRVNQTLRDRQIYWQIILTENVYGGLALMSRVPLPPKQPTYTQYSPQPNIEMINQYPQAPQQQPPIQQQQMYYPTPAGYPTNPQPQPPIQQQQMFYPTPAGYPTNLQPIQPQQQQMFSTPVGYSSVPIEISNNSSTMESEPKKVLHSYQEEEEVEDPNQLSHEKK